MGPLRADRGCSLLRCLLSLVSLSFFFPMGGFPGFLRDEDILHLIELVR